MVLLKLLLLFYSFLVFREETSPAAVEFEKEESYLHESPDASFSNSPDLTRPGQENLQGEQLSKILWLL